MSAAKRFKLDTKDDARFKIEGKFVPPTIANSLLEDPKNGIKYKSLFPAKKDLG